MKIIKPKNGDAQKKRSDREVRGVSPEAGRGLWWERFVKEVKAAASEPHIKQRYKSAFSQVWFNSTRSLTVIN